MANYQTSSGDVWDFISYKVYQDENFIGTLINANPHLRETVIFKAGVNLVIPPKPTVPNSSSTLPPWKK